MSYRRELRSSKASLFNDLEEGSLRTSSSYSQDINEDDNDKAVETLEDRVVFLKRICCLLDICARTIHGGIGCAYIPYQLTGDIHDEVENHNRFLDRMGNQMDASRGIMSGTMDRFKMVFKRKSSRRTCTLVASFVVSFLIIYYLIRILRYVN